MGASAVFSRLAQLFDVAISNPAAGDTLQYDAATSKFKNAPSGSITAVTSVKTGAYTANGGELIPVDTTSGAATITLPAAVAGGRPIVVKHITQGAFNTVTVAAAGTDVFNKAGGVTTLTLAIADQSVLLYPGAGIWYVEADQGFVNLVLPSRAKGYIYPPSTGDPSIDANELLNAESLLPATGGRMQLDVGPYDLTNEVNITKPLRISGLGPNGTNVANTPGSIFTGRGTKIVCSSPTAVPLRVNADGVKFEDLSIRNTSLTTPTAGAGIEVDTYGQGVHLASCDIIGFYALHKIVNGPEWWMHDCFLVDPVFRGIDIADADVADSTAGQISNSMIWAGPTNLSPSAGIYWSPAGGLRISNSKIVRTGAAAFAKGIWAQVADGITTSVFVMTGTSIENGVEGVRIEQAGTTGGFNKIVLTGNHIAGTNTSIILSGNAAPFNVYAVIVGNVIEGGAFTPVYTLNNVNGVRMIGNESALSGHAPSFTGTNTRLFIVDLQVATSGRPAGSAMRAGSRYWDTTLNKPVFADGSGNWRTADGTIV